MSCGARLAPFDIKELRDIMTEDELELDTMGDRKTALFLIMSDTDITFNFVIAMLQSQLKTIYKDAAETIIGNCDTMLFLGGKESSTLKEISETLGKETIDLYNTSDTRGNSPSFGTNYQKTGKDVP